MPAEQVIGPYTIDETEGVKAFVCLICGGIGGCYCHNAEAPVPICGNCGHPEYACQCDLDS